jgi:hypothetical protein
VFYGNLISIAALTTAISRVLLSYETFVTSRQIVTFQ